MVRKAFHDLGFKMGDGIVAFWKFAHRTEPVVVYSVALGILGRAFFLFPTLSLPPPHLRTAQGCSPVRARVPAPRCHRAHSTELVQVPGLGRGHARQPHSSRSCSSGREQAACRTQAASARAYRCKPSAGYEEGAVDGNALSLNYIGVAIALGAG